MRNLRIKRAETALVKQFHMLSQVPSHFNLFKFVYKPNKRFFSKGRPVYNEDPNGIKCIQFFASLETESPYGLLHTEVIS